jgi:ATP-dependent Clp protease ATP-binding subunit ClpA
MAPFRFDKLTVKAQEAVQAAQALADREGHQQLEPEHLLLALVEQEDGVVGALLAKLGARPDAIRRDIQAEIRRLPKVSGASGQYMGPRLKAVFDAAWDEMERLKDDYCSTEHLLVAIAHETDGAAGRVLRQAGVTKDGLYRALVDVRGSQRVTDQNPGVYQALERYSAPDGSPGRAALPDGARQIIRRVIQVLAADEEQPS